MVTNSLFRIQCHQLSSTQKYSHVTSYNLADESRIWFEKILYTDDRLLLNETESETSLSNAANNAIIQNANSTQRTIKIYKFKAPAFLVTNI